MKRPAARRADPELGSDQLATLDLLSTLVAIVASDGTLAFANAAFEDATGIARRALLRGRLQEWLRPEPPVVVGAALAALADGQASSIRFDAELSHVPALSPLEAQAPAVGRPAIHVHATLSPLAPRGRQGPSALLLAELVPVEQQARLERDERALGHVTEHVELIRNLAHEVKNPLGGIRGAAQLLAMGGGDERELAETTAVIVRECDRLKALVDRLLVPQRAAQPIGDVNVHEVMERVRALLLAEHPVGLTVERDYDTSLPEVRGDREALIQALLNLGRNAAQALSARIVAGDARIGLRTRIARQITIGKRRCRLALDLQVEDNGPGVPDAIRERIFQPLVSGRDGGSGLGLALAQTLVQRHEGRIDFDSVAGRTVFRMLIPLP